MDVATSITSLAISASLSRSMDESVEARTILTLAKKPLQKELSEEGVSVG